MACGKKLVVGCLLISMLLYIKISILRGLGISDSLLYGDLNLFLLGYELYETEEEDIAFLEGEEHTHTDFKYTRRSKWLEECPPYDGEKYSVHKQKSAGAKIIVSGVEYEEGVVLRDYITGFLGEKPSFVLFNTDEKYSAFTVTVGHVDGTYFGETEFRVYIDGILSDTFIYHSDSGNKTIDIYLNYAGNLKIEAIHKGMLESPSIALVNGIFYE